MQTVRTIRLITDIAIKILQIRFMVFEQVAQLSVLLTMDQVMVQFYWMMFSVLEVNPDCGTVRILALEFTTVVILKMPVYNAMVRDFQL